MYRIAIVATLAVLSSACTGALTAPSSAPTCAPRAGAYAVTMTQLPGGDCGAIAPTASTATIDAHPGPSAGCAGGATPIDACADDFEERCPATGWAETGTIAWSADGATGAGVLDATYTRQDGETCSATFEVAYQRTP